MARKLQKTMSMRQCFLPFCPIKAMYTSINNRNLLIYNEMKCLGMVPALLMDEMKNGKENETKMTPD